MKDRTLPASEFKAKCLRLLGDVAQQGNALVVTKRGRPIACVTAYIQPVTAAERIRRWGKVMPG